MSSSNVNMINRNKFIAWRNKFFKNREKRVPPKEQTIKKAINTRRELSRALALNNISRRRVRLTQSSRNSIRSKKENAQRAAEEAAQRAAEEAAQRAAASRARQVTFHIHSRNGPSAPAPSSTRSNSIIKLLKSRQLNMKPRGGYTRRKHRKQRNYRK